MQTSFLFSPGGPNVAAVEVLVADTNDNAPVFPTTPLIIGVPVYVTHNDLVTVIKARNSPTPKTCFWICYHWWPTPAWAIWMNICVNRKRTRFESGFVASATFSEQKACRFRRRQNKLHTDTSEMLKGKKNLKRTFMSCRQKTQILGTTVRSCTT